MRIVLSIQLDTAYRQAKADFGAAMEDLKEVGTVALDAALEAAVAPYRAAFENADGHTDKLPGNDADRYEALREELIELSHSIEGNHEHPPEWELAQIAGIAINWLRAIGEMPPARRDIAKELEQAREEGAAEGKAEERERWEPAVNLAMEWAAGFPLGGAMDQQAAEDVYAACEQALHEGAKE